MDLPISCDKGALVVLNHRLSKRVINRCRPPSDSDIIVPAGPVSLLGTSSMLVPSPEGLIATPEEIDQLLRQGDEMIPDFMDARILRIFCGARPLYAAENAQAAGGREISRSFTLLDHEAREGIG